LEVRLCSLPEPRRYESALQPTLNIYHRNIGK